MSLDDDLEHLAYIGSKRAKDLKGLLTQFLRQNRDVFAWTQADMGGIDPAVITHRLNANPSFKQIKKKRRSFAPERQKAINEEVGKLLQAGAIREVEYPEWLANVVLVKKANGKWRLCIDFTDINKACPKDNFPLSRIDLIVDATAGHELSVLWTRFPATIRSAWTPMTRKRHHRHSTRNLLLSGNAVWTQERRSNLPEVSKPNVSEADRRNYGSIHRRHAGKVYHSRSPHHSYL